METSGDSISRLEFVSRAAGAERPSSPEGVWASPWGPPCSFPKGGEMMSRGLFYNVKIFMKEFEGKLIWKGNYAEGPRSIM